MSDLASFEDLITRLRLYRSRRVYIIGNGGSYANAAHIANDLLACGVRAFTLDAATLTAIANDFSFSEVFVQWLRVVADPGDVLIALSGSGKSENILRAVEEAHKMGLWIWKEFGAPQGLGMQESEERQVQWGHELRFQLR